MCHAREVLLGRGFSSGASIAEKWGLEIFWGKFALEPPFETKIFNFHGEFSEKLGNIDNDLIKLKNRPPPFINLNPI